MIQDILYVDDTYADGRRVVATARNAAGSVVGYAYDSNGSNNGAGFADYIDASSVYSVTTCTQVGTDTRSRAHCWTTYF
ncbi:hypothetical protein GPZ77_34100 [Streptomyces sp. QHH-9511]|uniref:hypothetical protein n=1 Tax=Streptomyces sp. QHH-9511 TaxID=2684468 RepID=UPI00131944C5|nr:hypothetical protein [Streptomyces sp. QHH-9511]QGZ52648.1 hypothetical protein GPZ77_34100 [Streptomyces sp. QHH-9511]